MAIPFLSSEEFDELAHQHYDAGEYDEALEILREGLVRYPDSADLLVGTGYVRLAREEYAWALQSFSRALDVHPENGDGWVGLGEVLLKLGRCDEALDSFARVDALGTGDELELSLGVARALYREGMIRESRSRLLSVVGSHPESADARAALAYALHAMGDEIGARRELRRALRLDPELHEARIYLAHLLYERGRSEEALRELERVPPSDHWDTGSLWRYIDLKGAVDGISDQDPSLAPWTDRVRELDQEPDSIDHLLAEVEARFESDVDDSEPTAGMIEPLLRSLGLSGDEVHQVRTGTGLVLSGTWEQILHALRDSMSYPDEPLEAFMSRVSDRMRDQLGCEIPCDDAEAFLRASARLGFLQIEH